MNNKGQQNPEEREETNAAEAIDAIDADGEEADAEAQELYDDLREDLAGVIPDQVFDLIKSVRPLKAACLLLWEYGGRIRTNNPEIDLTGKYELPVEVLDLNDKIGDFTFEIALSPFIALARAVSGGINADEEVIQSRDLDGYVPISILKGDKVVRMGLVNYQDRRLELAMESPFNVRVDAPGDESGQEAAQEHVLEAIEGRLSELMKQMEEEPPQLYRSEAEEAAVTEWCEKHGYSVIGTFRTGVDLYH